MSNVDTNAIRHQSPPSGFEVVSSSLTDSFHLSRTKAFSRDVAMERDRSGESPHDARGRGRAQQADRGATASARPRLGSSSPPSRPRLSQGRRNRDTKYSGGDKYGEDIDRRGHERHRSRSADRRDRHHDDPRRPQNSPAQDSHRGPGKQDDGPSPPRQNPKDPDYPERTRDRSFSPGSRKRPRSRSPLPFPSSRSKRSKRDRDRERERRRRAEREERIESDHRKGRGPSRPNRPHSPSRRRSISPRYDTPHRRHGARDDPLDVPRRRSRSPPREGLLEDRHEKPPPRPRPDSKVRDQSRSPRPNSRRSSFSHTHSPTRHVGRPNPRRPSEMGAHSRRTSPYEPPPRHEFPPRSPREPRSRRSRKKAKIREEMRFGPRGPLASGANSIEVNTFRRTERRNSHEMPEQSRDVKPNPGEEFSRGRPSSRGNHDSSRRGSLRSPRHDSPTRVGMASDSRHSPRSPRLGDRNPHAPAGPAAHSTSIQSPPRPPSGPTAQSNSQGRGFSRGSFKGGMASDQGSQDDHYSRPTERPALVGPNEESASSARHGSIPIRSGTPNFTDERTRIEDGPQRQDDRREDASRDERASTDYMPPPRPPPSAPTGPASSKFSFAFKTSNKNPIATPKPEISQKFSAAPKKEQQLLLDDRDRDLPKDTPREPASARARAEHQQARAAPPEQPRTRKVIKIRRKLKPKPPLDPEFAKSRSIYFRKPGNASVIGSGTYGKVFKGQHILTKKLVALKRIRMEGEKDGFPVTAMREIKLLQSLRHTNVVLLHEVMIEKNDCYMVFEYLSHDLTGLLNHPSYKLDAAQKKHLSKQLFEGLDYLHKRGVLHRDIKAANILVSNEGILKLADFGLARFYAKRHQLDYTNRVITIWYRSPELLLGETQYGAAVDIWSAACVMVEIFTRHAIFPGDGGEISQLDKIYSILGTPNRKEWPGLADTPWFELLRPSYRKPNVFAKKYRERVPAAAFELLSQMFQYDPVKRPSAADVLEHAYFTIEQPPPRQAVELKDIKGDWHEFESKALRREKEKQQRDARRATTAAQDASQENEKKRQLSPADAPPEPKRPHLEEQASRAGQNTGVAVSALPERAIQEVTGN